MPVFSYKCRNCGASFQLERKLYESDARVNCPRCRTPHPERVRKSFLDKFYFMFEASQSGNDSCSSCVS